MRFHSIGFSSLFVVASFFVIEPTCTSYAANMSHDVNESEFETTTEINFRLDQHGRTVGETNSPQLDFRTRAVSGHIEVVGNEIGGNAPKVSGDDYAVVDDLLLDCEIADCSIMPRTFWVDHSFRPRCNLEQMACDILDYHCPIQSLSSPTLCGAEWWVQIRPPPDKISRYTVMKSKTEDLNCDAKDPAPAESDEGDSGISFHWDKDEDLRILCDGAVYVHPHLSTVTYLTGNNGASAPTFIAEDFRVNNVNGEWVVPPTSNLNDTNSNELSCVLPTPVSAFISWPAIGKHLCFDGRFLHAAPSDLLLVSQVASTVQTDNRISDDCENIRSKRRSRRYTFLVNIWIHHKPLNVYPFPDSMIDKMSGYTPFVPTGASNESPKIRLLLNRSLNVSDVTTAIIKQEISIHCTEEYTPHLPGYDKSVGENKTDLIVKREELRKFVWPMGGHSSGEYIHAKIPIETVQSKASTGGNVRIFWYPSPQNKFGMFLVKKPNGDDNNAKADREPDGKRSRIQ